MAQKFFITKGSTLPTLRMEVINDGRRNFHKLYTALQAATVTFSMTDVDSGVKKIANSPAEVLQKVDDGCVEKYVLSYSWNERDTKTAGIFKGEFTIKFDSDITMDGVTFPKGIMKVPIAEELIITVLDGSIQS